MVTSRRVVAVLVGLTFGLGFAVTEYLVNGQYTYWFALGFGLVWTLIAKLALTPSSRPAARAVGRRTVAR